MMFLPEVAAEKSRGGTARADAGSMALGMPACKRDGRTGMSVFVPVFDKGRGSVVSEMRQRTMHESRELRLVTCARLCEGLLKLTSGGGQSDPHPIRGRL
jgi:hypothetical protein